MGKHTGGVNAGEENLISSEGVEAEWLNTGGV